MTTFERQGNDFVWVCSYPEIVCKADLKGTLKNAFSPILTGDWKHPMDVIDPGELGHDSQATKDAIAKAGEVPPTPTTANPASVASPESLAAMNAIYKDNLGKKGFNKTIYAGDTGGANRAFAGRGPGGGL